MMVEIFKYPEYYSLDLNQTTSYTMQDVKGETMVLYSIIRLFHILSAIWFISGLIGRGISFRHAQREVDIHSVVALLRLSDIFEQRMVIPGSNAVFLFGLAISLMLGWPLFGFMQGAPQNWLLVSIALYLSGIPAVALYLVPRRKQRHRVAEESLQFGSLTPERSAALQDRGVRLLRLYELITVFIITILMVTKPF